MYPPIEQNDIEVIMKSINRIGTNETDVAFAKFRYGEKWMKYFLGTPYEENIELLKRVYSEG